MVIVAARTLRLVVVRLEAVDGDRQPALVAFEGRELVPHRGDLGEDLVHGGLEVGG